jgi:hypothetical protein
MEAWKWRPLQFENKSERYSVYITFPDDKIVTAGQVIYLENGGPPFQTKFRQEFAEGAVEGQDLEFRITCTDKYTGEVVTSADVTWKLPPPKPGTGPP